LYFFSLEFANGVSLLLDIRVFAFDNYLSHLAQLVESMLSVTLIFLDLK
jgi:hypothetical protein